MSRLSLFEDILTSVVCKLCSYSLSLSFLVSMPSFLLISADRFAATVYPLKLSTITGRTRTILLMLSWLFPMVLLSPVLYFASSENIAERRGFLCTSGEISALFTVYKMIESVPFYFIPLIRIIILNSWIMHSLRKADRVLREHGQRNATRHKRNKRIMKMLILIIVIFSFGWIPFGYVFCLMRAR